MKTFGKKTIPTIPMNPTPPKPPKPPKPVKSTRQFFVIKGDLQTANDWAGRPGFMVREDQLHEVLEGKK